MKWTGLNELREKYLAFYESKGHLRLPSFSLVPQGDKSLLLINSGMAPMKKFFTGEVTPPRKRVTICPSKLTALAPVRNASAPLTSSAWVRPHATARILKCWVTSVLAIISNTKRPLGLGNSARKCWKFRRSASISASTRMMIRRLKSGPKKWA